MKGEKSAGGYTNVAVDDEGRLRTTIAPVGLVDDPVVIAAASDSQGGLGKLPATIAQNEWLYVRCPTTGKEYVDWIVKHAQQADLVFYKSNSIEDEVTLTISSLADGETCIVSGLTYTAEDTGTDALYASRKFYTGGADATADAAELVKLLNADYTVTCASAEADDTVTVSNGVASYVFTGHATTTTVASHEWDIADDATAAAAIVSCVNDRQSVTCATAQAGDTVTITLGGGTAYVFTGHATTTTAAKREWDIADNDTAAAAIVTCVNDDDYGVPGVTASASSAVVSFVADTSDVVGFTVTTSNATRLATSAEYGVPGVVAAVNQGGEVYFTPMTEWAEAITVTSSNNTRLAVSDVDCPGIIATSAEGVVTLKPASRDECAPFIYAVTGTAAGHIVVSQAATLAGLYIDEENTAVADEAATSTTAGSLHRQSCDGYTYCYLGFMADNASAQAVTISAITI